MYLTFNNKKIIINFFDRDFKSLSHNYSTSKYPIEEVKKNHDIITNFLHSDKLITLKQVHGDKVVSGDYDIGEEPQADGIICNQANLTLGIQTADCVPVLFFNDDSTIIAAAHCGWKSAILNINKKIISEFNTFSQSKINGVIGPSIKQDSYEVDENFYHNFINNDQNNERFFICSDNNKFKFDLPGYVAEQLKKLDVNILYISSDDTYKNPKKYPSNRYSFHRGEKYKGSILSTITLKNTQ